MMLDRATINEKAEELLEAVWEALEHAGGHPDEAARSVSIEQLGEEGQEAAQLIAAGLATEPCAGQLLLTEAGRLAARSIIRRHRLGERLVVDVLDLDREEEMEHYACRFEHMVHPGLEERICTLLGHPRVCPHDKPIPKGPCCEEQRQEAGPVVLRLSAMYPGQRGTIAYLHSEDQSRLSKLLAMGVLPGAQIELQRRLPTFVFRVGFSQFAVDEGVAHLVFVRVED